MRGEFTENTINEAGKYRTVPNYEAGQIATVKIHVNVVTIRARQKSVSWRIKRNLSFSLLQLYSDSMALLYIVGGDNARTHTG